MRFFCGIFVLFIVTLACNKPETPSVSGPDRPLPPLTPGTEDHRIRIETGKTTPAEVVDFARSLTCIPYKYGSVSPEEGFDCSGFVTYVFNHFGIQVPRPSVDYTYVNRAVDIKQAKPGDLIFFTGTDSTIRVVGHMGIVVSNKGNNLTFIHATSGKGYGVTETPLNLYYQQRYMKTIRVFPQNDK